MRQDLLGWTVSSASSFLLSGFPATLKTLLATADLYSLSPHVRASRSASIRPRWIQAGTVVCAMGYHGVCIQGYAQS
eukprot:1537567-Pyramimonas_sp.AAC.1